MKKLLFKVARSRFAAYFIGNAFAHLTSLMPLDKLYVDENVIVFKHPASFWPIHWLAVPKHRIPTFMDLALTDDPIIFSIFQAVQSVTAQMDLKRYRLLVNGGAYQDVPQLHFHIAAGPSINSDFKQNETLPQPTNETSVGVQRSARVYAQLQSDYTSHFVIESLGAQRPFPKLNLNQKEDQSTLRDVLVLAQQTVTNNKLTQYTLFTNVTASTSAKPVTYHLVAG